MREILLTVLVALLAYLIGSFSTGTIISNAKGVNIRNEGSKNTGASNVLRVMGLKSGLICFLGDFFKALLACWLGSVILPGKTFGIARIGVLLAGLMVIVGHNWPVYYGFKGGKGVACSVAVIVFVDPLWGIISVVLCVGVIAATRFISLGSMTMLLTYMIFMCIAHWGEWFTCLFCLILFVLCVIRHRSNIGRLLSGTENKIGQKVKPNQGGDGEQK